MTNSSPGQKAVLRKAIYSDKDCIYEWRNDPATRSFFLNPNAISKEEHDVWFSKMLNDSHAVVLVASDSDEARIGVIRFDIDKKESVAEISIYVDPRIVGRGWGKAILAAGIAWIRENQLVHRLRARVIPRNVASVKLFKKVGFEITYCAYDLDLINR